MNTLFIDACVREESRTRILANKYLPNDATIIKLNELNLLPLNKERLEKRNSLIDSKLYDDEMFNLAKQFANADQIIIAAPFWDLGFPALLKIYLENIAVSGITFYYKLGKPVSLCKAKKLIYVTTSGGPIFDDYGFSYVKSLAKNFYNIAEVICYRVELLDVKNINGNDVLNQQIIEIKDN